MAPVFIVDLPLRFQLRYDPLFLELGWRIAHTSWGALSGVSIQGSCDGSRSRSEVLSFLLYLFGLPSQKPIYQTSASLAHLIALYPTFGMQALLTIVPEMDRPVSLWGSLSFTNGTQVEFRYGQDYFIGVSVEEGSLYHCPFPEGDPSLYFRGDYRRGRQIVSEELEIQVAALLQSLGI
ncbi:MAG: hypothetical protein SNJ56_02865 [Termitinemataceae bacterium]